MDFAIAIAADHDQDTAYTPRPAPAAESHNDALLLPHHDDGALPTGDAPKTAPEAGRPASGVPPAAPHARKAPTPVVVSRDGLSRYEIAAAAAMGIHQQQQCDADLWALQVEIISHSLFQRLVKAHFRCLKLGHSPEQVAALDEQEDRYHRSLEANVRCIPEGDTNAELDKFMVEYCNTLEACHKEQQNLLNQAHLQLDFYDQKLQNILMEVKPSELVTRNDSHSQHQTGSSKAGADSFIDTSEEDASIFTPAEEDFEPDAKTPNKRQEVDILSEIDVNSEDPLSAEQEMEIFRKLKQTHYASILGLKQEFMKRRKKGKLPKDATATLKKWWADNLLWPYPSEEIKKGLAESSELSPTQINNWFINQRKRHWHKLFPAGPPTSPEEAKVELDRKYGSLEAALAAAAIV